MKGKLCSEEHRRKISEANKGRPRSEEERKHIIYAAKHRQKKILVGGN